MADDPVTCTPPNQFNPITKRCTISVGDGGENGGGDTPPGDTGGENSGGGGSNGPARCEVGNYGYGDLGVVTGLADPQPPGNDPVWEGHYPDGAIYKCEGTPGVGGGRIGVPPLRLFWAATPPNAPPPPDPEDLAREAIAQMQLSPIQIGIVPEDAPGRIGVVGMPTYMWAENPGQNTIGPITRSASAGGFTVTATATVDRIVWDMGDGSSVTCEGPGTPYEDRFGREPSPTCGHTYTSQGRFTVTARSYWTVAWQGIGETGVIPLDLADSTQITIGEAQVIGQ